MDSNFYIKNVDCILLEIEEKYKESIFNLKLAIMKDIQYYFNSISIDLNEESMAEMYRAKELKDVTVRMILFANNIVFEVPKLPSIDHDFKKHMEKYKSYHFLFEKGFNYGNIIITDLESLEPNISFMKNDMEKYKITKAKEVLENSLEKIDVKSVLKI